MLYRQDISGCLLECIGALGLGAGELGAFLERTRPSLDHLRDQHAKGTEPLLAIPARRDDLMALAPLAREFRRFEHVVVLGIGGSSLGGQTLYALADRGFGPEPGVPRLHFMETIDPASFEALLQSIDLTRTGVIVISKSGGTAEPLMQFMIVLEALRRVLGRKPAAERCLAVTEPKDNPLRRMAERESIRALDHGPEVAYLAGRTMGDLMEAEKQATADSLMQRGRPTRVIRLERLDEERLGALLMHFILETLIAADLLGVPAFGQPAVEQGKVLARRYLGQMSKAGAQSPA
jgi:glucose-6-phosphate isomerase